MLHGLLYAGQVPGAPAEFQSALFIGGRRQVAVLFPKPNRVLPAVLAPYHIVPGTLTVFDFDRRERPLARSAATPLAATPASPFFVTLDAERAQAAPKLGLARPWLRMPAMVLCGKESTFRIEIDAPAYLSRSYIRLLLPRDAPVESSFSSRSLRAKAGDTLSFDVTLTRTSDEPFEPTELTVHLRLEGETLRFPITLRPLVELLPLKATAEITDAQFRVARLTPRGSEDQEQDAQIGEVLHAAYQNESLHVAIALPADAAADAVLQLGIALENADAHAEIRIEDLLGQPRLRPAHGTTSAQIGGWRCRLLEDRGPAARFADISIPAASLGLSDFRPGTRLLLAARYVQPPSGRVGQPVALEWGAGLDGTRSSVDYHWIRLVQAPTDK
jgi:hypothetical protein